MAYSNNPNLPRARASALRMLLQDGVPLGVVAKRYGVHRTTIYRWKNKWRELNKHVEFTNPNRPTRPVSMSNKFSYCRWLIPTGSARPHTSPNALPNETVDRILTLRYELKKCAEVIWFYLTNNEGVCVSLSSVKRTLARNHEYDRPKHKKKLYRTNIKRPTVTKPGDLVEIDTVHLVDPNTRTRKYIYTVIDLATRMSYARVYPRLSPACAAETALLARDTFGFTFSVLQSDNGSEFGKFFRDRISGAGITHRHTRPHRPNDNAHIERFNRTLRKECIGNYMSSHRTLDYVQNKLDKFLDYYNYNRIHLSLNCKTPANVKEEMLQRC